MASYLRLWKQLLKHRCGDAAVGLVVDAFDAYKEIKADEHEIWDSEYVSALEDELMKMLPDRCHDLGELSFRDLYSEFRCNRTAFVGRTARHVFDLLNDAMKADFAKAR